MKSNLYFCGVSDIKSFIKKLILGLVNIIVTTRVFTIEHSNHQGDEFASILESNHIVMLVDVRRYPSSKSFPQFNKEILAKES